MNEILLSYNRLESLRHQLIECCRFLVFSQGYVAGAIFNHLSARTAEGMLITLPGLMFDELEHADLLEVALDGEQSWESIEFHAALYSICPKINCIIHVNNAAVSELCIQKCWQSFAKIPAVLDLPYVGYEVSYLKDLASTALDLDRSRFAAYTDHGISIGAESVPAAFAIAFSLLAACEFQVVAQASGEMASPVLREVLFAVSDMLDEAFALSNEECFKIWTELQSRTGS